MRQIQAKILSNDKVADAFFRMRVASPHLGQNAQPGQFVEVRCSAGAEPLLRRPLGVHRIMKNGIEMLYEIVGKGTRLLSEKKAGQLVDIIGPLGSGFDIRLTGHQPPATSHYSGSPMLVAGGIGVAPLVALAGKLAHSAKGKAHGNKIRVIIGAKTKHHILCENDFKKLGCRVFVATEDGSKGHKGLATDLLNNALTTNGQRPTTIYACGPTGMLKAVAGIAKAHGAACQVSLEERMACGVGVCLGCPVKVKPAGEYKMVCKDGPVFNAEEVAW